MATETEKLYNQSAQAAQQQAATPSVSGATSPYTTGNQSLDNYNNARYDQINKIYDAQRDSAVNRINFARDKATSDAQAAYDKISPQYQAARNEAGAEYERIRRNNNLQAAASGINTGAGSQMALAQGSVYQSGQAKLQEAENEALNEADRNMLTMKQQYQADMNEALSKNDTERAAALLNEYGQEYDRLQDEAKQLAAYGNFSLYETLYGPETAASMESTWMLQNPQLAYTLGKITADQYFQMTGKRAPRSGGGSGGRGGGGSGYGGGYVPLDENGKLDYKAVAYLRGQGYSDAQIKQWAEEGGLTGVDTAFTRAGQTGVAGGKSAAGALASYKNATSQPSTQPAQNNTSGGQNFWQTVKDIYNSLPFNSR